MSRNYDNWERLVTAVLRREQDKQIAFSHSRDPSGISSPTSSSFDLSFRSTSQIDDDDHHHQSLVLGERRSQLPMDYSDLTLDHQQWKTMLPPNKREIVWKSASLSFFLVRGSGKNCFLLGAANLIKPSAEGLGTFLKSTSVWPETRFSGMLPPETFFEQFWEVIFFEQFWEVNSHPKSRFSEVAKLKHPSFFYVKCSVKTKMLSPDTIYTTYFVFGFTDKNEKQLAVDLSIMMWYGESDTETRTVNLKPSKERADGWNEMQLGDFCNDEGYDGKVTVVVKLKDPNFIDSLSGLTVEGIEFRPLKGKRNRKGKGIFLNSKISR